MSAGLDIAGLPTFDDPSGIRAAVEDLASRVRAVHVTAADVQEQWCRIAGAYNAPEQEHVICAMTPPSEAALRLTEQVTTAEAALMTYADRLAELDAQRRTLVTDLLAFTQDRAAVEAENADNNAWDTVTDHYRNEAVDVARREEALHDRVVALQVAKDRAEIECTNAIGDLWGAPDHHLNGETSVDNPYRYGYTADGYDHQASSGHTPWGRPASWTEGNFDVTLHRLDRGAKDSVLGIKDAAFDLAGWHGEGRADASRSGIAQLGNDVWNHTRWSSAGGVTGAERQASAERLGHVGQAAVGWGTWSHDGWHTAGGFVPDVAASYVTGGVFLGARTTSRGALSSPVPPRLRLATAQLAPVVRAQASAGLNTARRELNNFLDANRSVSGPVAGPPPAFAGNSPQGLPPAATPPPSLWAMDTGGHEKGSTRDAGPSAPTTVAGHDVPPISWGKHADVSDQYPPSVRDAVAPIIAKAVAAEPTVTRDFLSALPEEARAYGLEHRIKSPDSLASKIRRQAGLGFTGEVVDAPKDVLRYTSVVETDDDLIPSAHVIVDRLADHGWRVTHAHHSYVEGNRYMGVHCTVESEVNGTAVELQFHSEQSIDVKDRTHAFYELSRDPGATSQQRAAATRASEQLTNALPFPPDLGAFTRLGEVPVEVKIYKPKE